MRTLDDINIEKLSDATIGGAKDLIREYLDWIQVDLFFQNVDEELKHFPDKYREPEGAFLVARDGAAVVGCVGMKKIDDGICEMKRLFVKDEYKRLGIGRLLVEDILQEARSKGYRSMRLDTLRRMDTALALYRKFGFEEIGQYVDNPIDDAVFLEKKL